LRSRSPTLGDKTFLVAHGEIFGSLDRVGDTLGTSDVLI
jgi:hypothetical protein